MYLSDFFTATFDHGIWALFARFSQAAFLGVIHKGPYLDRLSILPVYIVAAILGSFCVFLKHVMLRAGFGWQRVHSPFMQLSVEDLQGIKPYWLCCSYIQLWVRALLINCKDQHVVLATPFEA